uniref:Uncharacterized protein n=1 Tax=Panagrolaimus superbus TaxID=310955 RepID=A0A914XXB3_9BILA
MFVNDNDNDNNDDENDGSNATITTSDKIDQNVKEFLEIYYFQRYKKFDKDLQAFDFEQGKSDKSWNLGKIIESLLSVMMLTGKMNNLRKSRMM